VCDVLPLISVCVCVCMHVIRWWLYKCGYRCRYVRVCVCECVRVCAHMYYCVCVCACVKGGIYILYSYIDRYVTTPRERSSSAPRPEATWTGDRVRGSSVWEMRVEAFSESILSANMSSMLLSILPTTARPSKMRYLCVYMCVRVKACVSECAWDT